MAKPTVSTTQLELSNVTQDNTGFYILEFSLPAILRFAVEDSGNSHPYTKHIIKWGDGKIDQSNEELPVARQFQYPHVYASSGDYFIEVQAVNSDGEISDIVSETVIPVRVDVIRQQKKRFFKWFGLALPITSIKTALNVVEDVLPSQQFHLGADTIIGSTSAVLLGDELKLGRDTPVSISQAGKSVYLGRVVDFNLNVLTLDREIPEVYEQNIAIVEIQTRFLKREIVNRRIINKEWYYPITFDEDLARSAVTMILSTRPMERLMRPSFGSRLHELPFEQNDTLIIGLARQYTANAIAEWEGRVDIKDFVVLQDGNDSVVKMTLVYRDGFRITDLTIPLRAFSSDLFLQSTLRTT